jgi:serine protease inhibitor
MTLDQSYNELSHHSHTLQNKSFISLAQVFGADIGKLEEKNPEVAVNNWVKEQTKGKIPKIVGENYGH